ncbi:hypothetical protein PSY23_23605, partial [Shigella flexneri]|nr:hypothetical protein [Shigella flexneri]
FSPNKFMFIFSLPLLSDHFLYTMPSNSCISISLTIADQSDKISRDHLSLGDSGFIDTQTLAGLVL